MGHSFIVLCIPMGRDVLWGGDHHCVERQDGGRGQVGSAVITTLDVCPALPVDLPSYGAHWAVIEQGPVGVLLWQLLSRDWRFTVHIRHITPDPPLFTEEGTRRDVVESPGKLVIGPKFKNKPHAQRIIVVLIILSVVVGNSVIVEKYN